jgi:hypothetical protein
MNAITRFKDGEEWRIGEQEDVAWVVEALARPASGTSPIPLTFSAYCEVALPRRKTRAQYAHDQAMISVLRRPVPQQTWWLGYLDTNRLGDQAVFPDAPRVVLYKGWEYVLVGAGPDQALRWRESEGSTAPWKGALPDLMFPADRSWICSTLWDERRTWIGGSKALITAISDDEELAPRTRIVRAEELVASAGN